MMSRDAEENEDTSYQPIPSLNLENLGSDMMKLMDNPETETLMNQILGGPHNSRFLDSADSSLSSHMSQGSQASLNSNEQQQSKPSPFVSNLPPIQQPAAASNPSMEVFLVNSIIRFRYDSELNNRRTGKEELLKIKFTGVEGNVTILLHTVDTINKKAHPYWLIGDNCINGMFVAKMPITKATNYECTCKATLKIPKRNEYQSSLQGRQREAESLSLFMKNDDYWTANQNMKECRDFRLSVEARYEVAGKLFQMNSITHPLSNAKEGKCFMIHRIMPYVSPASGIHKSEDYIIIVLTVDSYIPKSVQVEFVDEEVGWSAMATRVNIIKNCIECEVPPYKDQDLLGAREVIIRIHDKQKSMVAAYNFMYKENEETVMAKKRKMAVEYCAPPELLLESGIDTSIHTNQRRPVLKPSRTKKLGSGGFLPNFKSPSKGNQTSSATTEQTVRHYGINPQLQLPQPIVKKEPVDTYGGTCYQNIAMISDGEEVTNLLTKGHDPNLQSMSGNGADPISYSPVSLLLPSGSDGSDRDISMETSFNRPASTATTLAGTGGSNYSQSDEMNIQKIIRDLVAGSPGQVTSQQVVSEPQKMDENSVNALLQSLQQAVMRNADGQENSQLTFPDDVAQLLNQPMFSTGSSLDSRDQAPVQPPTNFPVHHTFSPALQRTTQDIQNMLSAQQQYPSYGGMDATEAGDLETDGDSQAQDNVRLVWDSNESPCEEQENLSDTEVDGDTEWYCSQSGVASEVIRAEAVLVKTTHPTPSAAMTGKSEKTERKNSSETCIKYTSESSADLGKEFKDSRQTNTVQNDTSDLEKDTQIDPGVYAQVKEGDQDGCLESRSPRSGDMEGRNMIEPYKKETDKANLQENVTESLKKLTL